MSSSVVMAALAGGLATLLGSEALAALGRVKVLHAVASLLAPARAAGLDGRVAQRTDQIRLTLLTIAVTVVLAWSLLGLPASLMLAACGPLAATALIRLRQRRWRARLAGDAAAAARAIADLMAGGNSISVAIEGAASDAAVAAPTRAALREVALSIALGVNPDLALDSLRLRAGPGPWESIVTAIRLQRRSGGNLADLLRQLAAQLDGTARARRDARAASAQARLTARIVVALPLIGAAIFALAAPDAVAVILESALPRTLVAAAAVMQLVALFAVRRVARVKR